MLNIGWFSTGRGPGSRQLLEVVYNYIQSGDIDGKITFVFCNRSLHESTETDIFFDQVHNYNIPLITFSSQKFKDAISISGNPPQIIEQYRIAFDREVMKLLKGYTIDKLYSHLKEEGFKKFVVNMGGDLRVYIVEDDTATIKIQHPRDSEAFWGKFEIRDAAVATSGDYERFFELDGVRYHHILSPFTGYPQRDCISVTIVTDEAERADAVATAVFVMGPQKGSEFINKFDDVEGIIIYKEDDILKSFTSEGMVTKYRYTEYKW